MSELDGTNNKQSTTKNNHPNSMKFIFKIIAGSIFIFAITGMYLTTLGTADLRRNLTIEDDSSQKARALLESCAKAHGQDAWKNIKTYSLNITDEFFPPMGEFSHPFESDTVELNLTYVPNTYTGQMHFLSTRRKGRIWGIQGWKSYWIDKNGRVYYTESENIKFWLPTYQYFFEFPFRILNADTTAYVGKDTIDDQICDGLLVSWNTLKPQRHIDQYVVWINQETQLIEKLDYTIRDAYNFLTGSIYYKDYQYFDEDILLPTRLPVESNLLKEGLLHEIKLTDFSRNKVAIGELMRNPNIKITGDRKD